MATATSDSVITPTIDGGNGTLEDEFINGLVQGGSWVFSGPRDLTYSFNINDDGAGGVGPGGDWTATYTTAVTQALTAWSSVANINFQQVTSGTFYFESTADLAFTLTGDDLQTQFGAVGLGIFPDPVYADLLVDPAGYPNAEGDVFLDNFSSIYSSVAVGSTGYWAILHEIGHALGLKHTSDDGGNGKPTFSSLGIGAYDSSQYTAMVPVLSGMNAGSPMLLDILAIQAIYGANNNYRTGDDTYDISQNSYGNTIWDAGGSADWLSAFTAAGPAVIDLRDGHFSGYGGALNYAIAYGVTIEHAAGSGFNDLITGNDANNTLDGRGGADTLTGGLGNDLYLVDNAGDVVVELAGQGVDRVWSSISYVLADTLENLDLDGFNPVSGTGNSGNNILKGNSSSNVLNGLGGNDTLDGIGGVSNTLIGGTGDDVYYTSVAGDVIQENADEGTDTVVTGLSAALPDNVESLILTGTGSVNGAGNDSNNILSGNSSNNILAGGPGNDTYIVDNSGDLVMELGGSGIDEVQSSVTYNLMQAWHAENLTLTGGSVIDGSGNWLDNVITGNGAANVLDGNRGNDTLDGGVGNDTLIGGLGDDVLVWDAADGSVQGGTGNDTLRLAGSGMTLDLTVIANTVLTDTEIIDLTGSGNNTLTLALADVLAISSTTDLLTVDGNAGDTVNLQGGWVNGGGAGYTSYTQGLATLLVDSDISVVLA